MKKRIAVFASAWNEDHVGRILLGMHQEAQRAGVDLYIFNAYGGFEAEEEYNRCEYSIFELPQLETYDGVLIVSNNIDSIGRLKGLIEQIKCLGIPCINLEQERSDMFFMGTNNYQAMYEVVEHLIVAHGCKTFNYVGGPENNVENCQRKQGFKDALKNHGIQVKEQQIIASDFTGRGAEKAFHFFETQGVEVPDAVVCANDDMAMGYIEALQEHGYCVPDDCRVTGFDNIFQAQNYYPSVTSVARSKESLGHAAVLQLLGMMEGQVFPHAVYTPHIFCPNASCGCGISMRERNELIKVTSKKISLDKNARWYINLMQKHFLICQNASELEQTLSNELRGLGITNICILANDVVQNTGGYPDAAHAYYHGKKIPFHRMQEANIFPEDYPIDNTMAHTYIILPLHLQGMGFGYCVIENGIDCMLSGNMFYCVSALDIAMDNIYQNRKIRELNKQLSYMYLHDSMTGIFNRFALKSKGEPLLMNNLADGRNTLFLFADMDGLKMINDTYGHDVGDLAIVHMAEIIQQSLVEDAFCIRYGGDEFLILGTCDDETKAVQIEQNIVDGLQKFNQMSKLPVKLAVSIGYFLAGDESVECSVDYFINKADQMMYQIKKNKKQNIKGL